MWSLQTTCNVSQTTLFSPKKGIEEQTQLKRIVTFTRCSRRTSPREREVRSAFAATYSPGVPFLAWLKRVYAAEQGQVQFLYLASWTGCIFSTSQAVKRERRLAISLLQDCGINIYFFQKTEFRHISLRNCQVCVPNKSNQAHKKGLLTENRVRFCGRLGGTLLPIFPWAPPRVIFSPEQLEIFLYLS